MAAVKVDESTILTVPPESCVALTWDRENVKGFGIVPCGLLGTWLLSGGGAMMSSLAFRRVEEAYN